MQWSRGMCVTRLVGVFLAGMVAAALMSETILAGLQRSTSHEKQRAAALEVPNQTAAITMKNSAPEWSEVVCMFLSISSVPLPRCWLVISAPGVAPLGPSIVKSPQTVILISPPWPPSTVLFASIELPACIVMFPPTFSVISHALDAVGSAGSLQT